MNLDYSPVKDETGSRRSACSPSWSRRRRGYLPSGRSAKAKSRFRTLADNIAQFAWMADEKGSIFWYNKRWFDYTGTTLEEMKGWGWRKVHHPDHVDRVVAKISALL